MRNLRICQKAEELFREGRQVMILVQRIEHGKTLDDLLWSFKGPSFIPHQFISGKEKSEDREKALEEFKNGDLPVLIATTILDEGVDVPKIDALIIAGGNKARIGALQRIGRGLRTGGNFSNLKVVDFADLTQKYLIRHALARLKIYKSQQAFNIYFSEIGKKAS